MRIRTCTGLVTGLALTILAGGVVAPAAAGEEASATEVVKKLQAGLLDAMRHADALGYKGRYQRLEPLVTETHDLDTVAKLTVRRYWKTLDRSQRAALTRTFHDLSVATYAARFHAFHQERFEVRGERPLPRQKAVVESYLVKPGGKKVQFNYVLRKNAGRWRILNIVVDGVSDLALKRADYGAVMKKEGFPALLRKLQAQIKAYAAGDPK